MVLLIFILGFLLLAAGIAAFFGALNLLPTDLGLAYFSMGATCLVGATIVFAIGLATRHLAQNLAALGQDAGAPLAGDMPPPSGDGSEMPAIPAGTGLVVGAGLAAGAVAGALPNEERGATATVPGSLDQMGATFERELFAEPFIAVPPVDAATPEGPMDWRSPNADESPFVLPALPMPGLPDIRLDPPLTTGRPAVEKDAELLEEPVQPAITGQDAAVDLSEVQAGADVEMEPDPASADRNEDERPAVIDSAADVSAGETEPPPSLPPPSLPSPSPPAPGLIEDADYAAIAAEDHPLAPLASLEIVGSYDSGGTRFTMYSDGSVTATGPDGENRFRSLDELRRHIDAG